MPREIQTTIDIHASAERVWDTLLDFASYPEWNPFVKSIAGSPQVGERLTVRIQPPGGSAMTFKPTVKAADQGKEFRWLGTVGVRGLFDGEHHFRIQDCGDGVVRLHHGEQFSGVLVPLMWKSIEPRTRAGFTAMNEALKARAESAPAAAV